MCKSQKQKKIMKKTMLWAVAAALISLMACGPSKQEIAKREQARQDSIRMADSVAAVQKAAMEQARQDSIARAQAEAEMAAKEQARQDSIAQAEAKNKKQGGKKKK